MWGEGDAEAVDGAELIEVSALGQIYTAALPGFLTSESAAARDGAEGSGEQEPVSGLHKLVAAAEACAGAGDMTAVQFVGCVECIAELAGISDPTPLFGEPASIQGSWGDKLVLATGKGFYVGVRTALREAMEQARITAETEEEREDEAGEPEVLQLSLAESFAVMKDFVQSLDFKTVDATGLLIIEDTSVCRRAVDAGYYSIRAIANAEVGDLIQGGIHPEKARRLVDHARARMRREQSERQPEVDPLVAPAPPPGDEGVGGDPRGSMAPLMVAAIPAQQAGAPAPERSLAEGDDARITRDETGRAAPTGAEPAPPLADDASFLSGSGSGSDEEDQPAGDPKVWDDRKLAGKLVSKFLKHAEGVHSHDLPEGCGTPLRFGRCGAESKIGVLIWKVHYLHMGPGVLHYEGRFGLLSSSPTFWRKQIRQNVFQHYPKLFLKFHLKCYFFLPWSCLTYSYYLELLVATPLSCLG